jgi:hypothetical protein
LNISKTAVRDSKSGHPRKRRHAERMLGPKALSVGPSHRGTHKCGGLVSVVLAWSSIFWGPIYIESCGGQDVRNVEKEEEELLLCKVSIHALVSGKNIVRNISPSALSSHTVVQVGNHSSFS